MRRTFFIPSLVALATLPAVAAAQRTRTQSNRHTEDTTSHYAPTPKGPSLRGRDLEDQNPFKTLIDKRKDLKLTDAQIKAMKEGESRLKDSDKPLYHAVDSLVDEMRPPLNPGPEFSARLINATAAVQSTLGDIATSYDEAIKPTLATLDPDQQAQARELLAKAKEDYAKEIREKLRPGR